MWNTSCCETLFRWSTCDWHARSSRPGRTSATFVTWRPRISLLGGCWNDHEPVVALHASSVFSWSHLCCNASSKQAIPLQSAACAAFMATEPLTQRHPAETHSQEFPIRRRQCDSEITLLPFASARRREDIEPFKAAVGDKHLDGIVFSLAQEMLLWSPEVCMQERSLKPSSTVVPSSLILNCRTRKGRILMFTQLNGE